MAEHQEEAKRHEREIPVLTVLKNGCILKNIFLLDNPPPSISISENAAGQESETEEILVVGRHPDCNIKLEHPSISRFHLRIHSKPSSRSLHITDLSSVHGTWISGKKVEAGVRMKLNEGDTLHLGASSRLYRLNWVPLSRAYDLDDPFVPQLDDAGDAIGEETEVALLDQDKEMLFDRNDEVESLSDNLEGLEKLFSDEDFGLSLQKTSPVASEVPEDSYESISEEEEEKNSSPGLCVQENELCISQPCHFEEENRTPSAAGRLEATEISGMNSEKKSALNIWSRRGKSESVLVKVNSARTNMSLKVKKPLLDEDHESESVLKYPDYDEENFMLDKENASPESILFRSSKGKSDENLKNEPFLVSPISCQDEEIFTPDKENITPNRRLFGSVKKIAVRNPSAHRSSPLKPAYRSSIHQEEAGVLFASQASQNRNLKNEPFLVSPISSVGEDEEVFTSDKENITPNRRLFGSVKKIAFKNPSPHRSSPLKPSYSTSIHQEEAGVLCASRATQNREVFQELKSTNSASKGHGSSLKQSASLEGRANREPLCPLPVNIKIGSKLSSTTTKVAENKWTIVVDISSLLNKKSRNELQLLRGLKGTSLVVPRIVVRELDCMLKRGGWFTGTTEVSAALKYIEESMAVAEGWIHVQSSAEEGRLVPPTPPASPHWFGDDMWASSIGSSPFSPCSLQEIVTPTAGDHILDYALYYRRIRKDGQLVILTDDVTLKIKAMAEGVLCETAEEFRRSLVNPFSARFVFSNCSPIGLTWSAADDAVLKEKYYPSPSKKILPRSGEGGGVKGLKLILMHNSSFRQTKPVC